MRFIQVVREGGFFSRNNEVAEIKATERRW